MTTAITTMTTINRFNLDLDPSRLITTLNQGRIKERYLKEAAVWLEAALQMISPKVLLEVCQVVECGPQRALLRSAAGAELEIVIGENWSMLARAREAVVSVATIGPAVEAEVRRLQEESRMFASYMLDMVGVALLRQVSNHLNNWVEDYAAAKNWGLSLRLSPGSLPGWRLEDQAGICSLLPLGEHGIRLNEAGLLVPYKSVSCLIGLGPDYGNHTVRSACHLCDQKPTCWARKL